MSRHTQGATAAYRILDVKETLKLPFNEVDVTRGFETQGIGQPKDWILLDTESKSATAIPVVTNAIQGERVFHIQGGVSETQAYVRYNFGSSKTRLTSCFWYYITGFDIANNQANWAIGQAAASSNLRVGLSRDYIGAGHYFLRMKGAPAQVVGTYDLPLNAWYRFEIDMRLGDTSTVSIYDQAGTILDSLSTTANNAFNNQFLFLGQIGDTGRLIGTPYFDALGVNFTTFKTPLWEYICYD